MAGYIAPVDYWKRFCGEWQAVLAEYKVPYFHFRELNAAGRSREGSPYYGWNEDKTDDFIYALAKIAGDVAVPFGSNVFLAPPGHKYYRRDTWKQTFDLFFEHFLQMMTLHWPALKEPVQFFFDRQSNKEIVKQLNASHSEHRAADSRIGDYSFDDKTQNLPLQAADMVSYALGQSGERAFHFQRAQNNRILDVLLFKNQYPKGHPNNLSWCFNDAALETLTIEFREHKKLWDADRKQKGLPKSEYFPGIHFDQHDKFHSQ